MSILSTDNRVRVAYAGLDLNQHVLTYDDKPSALKGSIAGEGRQVYLAGPMTGYPQFNFPLFHKVAEELRTFGYKVISPAELDDPKSREVAMASDWGDPAEYHKITGLTWADFLARDVKLISDGGIHYVVTLPGWESSRGARLETFVAHLNSIPTFAYHGDGHIRSIPLFELAAAWAGGGGPLEWERP